MMIEMPRIFHCIRAFPNLKTLTTDTFSIANIFKQHDMDVQRSLNKREQATRGSWQRLELYDGYTYALYHLGIACTINLVKLLDTGDECQPSLLKAVFGPRDLALRIAWGGLSLENDFLAALSAKAFQNLLKLDLSI
ncbi:hypothetical protein PYCCODRAFT_725099 [Trametes coccinea BRFM310]|uniref:Uncharacterized protein n=1 Tax=Trametes coccinea (strain BRFM310) TaxID=1353009 RepID=A0A1Y2IFW2_TRAC3|nr:hypothetical protein PYCCODRAFT_725099 [Trametes coccinea BRFM310]